MGLSTIDGRVGPPGDARAGVPGVRRGRRRAAPGRGPRPVRPGVAAVPVRPVTAAPLPARARVLARPASGRPGRVVAGTPSARRYRLRRAVAGAVLMLVSAGAVVGWGQLAGLAGDAVARSTVPSGTREVSVRAGDTVWGVARRAAPASDTSAVVERIVVDNGLSSTSLRVGQVLRVPAG
ncbi:LysM peptidoglycan-binding domain-containing protein [Pseudonocardia acidicola]|uniref:LysM peptidoglycan-binding domain-containing protein n=1 Tax=Pseudonocardia acidicola TaxID=2724939 RepID=A0ABX1S2U1_9PSEU|nr:LysM peptidoglycan-binding domain-containing protein [Pseudonocardia acidicola]NMH95870.1 LysM peptidoglycan-binding domain-containing protein [Pseudonocardia acidicola]